MQWPLFESLTYSRTVIVFQPFVFQSLSSHSRRVIMSCTLPSWKGGLVGPTFHDIRDMDASGCIYCWVAWLSHLTGNKKKNLGKQRIVHLWFETGILCCNHLLSRTWNEQLSFESFEPKGKQHKDADLWRVSRGTIDYFGCLNGMPNHKVGAR